MTKNSAFFIKIFCTTTAFFYIAPLMAVNTPGNIATQGWTTTTPITGPTITNPASTGTMLQQDLFSEEDTTPPQGAKIVCAKNEYLVSCGDMSLGTYWLMGKGTTSTPNIYDYSDDSSYVNMENLRKLFRGEEITYTDENGVIKTIDADKVDTMRKSMIGVCHPLGSSYQNRKCEKCPLNGSVPASWIKIGKNSNDVTYNIYTIADCYISEFTDTTGSYKYLPTETLSTNTNIKTTKGEKCYHNKSEVTGTPFISIETSD